MMYLRLFACAIAFAVWALLELVGVSVDPAVGFAVVACALVVGETERIKQRRQRG